MKKLINLLTMTTLISTTLPIPNMVFSTNLNEKYNKNNKIKNFIAIPGITGIIWTLATDNDGNVYVGSNDGLYKSIKGKSFNKLSGITGIVGIVKIDRNDNIYAVINGKLYKKEFNNNIFHKISEISEISSLTTDKDGNVYVGSNDGNIYEIFRDTINLVKITSTIGPVSALATDNDGNIYAGSKREEKKSTLYRWIILVSASK